MADIIVPRLQLGIMDNDTCTDTVIDIMHLAFLELIFFLSMLFAGMNILGSYYQQDPETRALGLFLEGTGAFGGLGTTLATPVVLGTAGTAVELGSVSLLSRRI